MAKKACPICAKGTKMVTKRVLLRGKYNPTGKLPFTVPADKEAVENNASDVPGYAETFDYVYTNAVGDDYALGYGLSYVGATYLIEEIDRLEEEGQFANHGAARSLQAQLAPVAKFETQNNAEKVVKHVKKFTRKLEQQYEKGKISETAYEELRVRAAELLERWE